MGDRRAASTRLLAAGPRVAGLEGHPHGVRAPSARPVSTGASAGRLRRPTSRPKSHGARRQRGSRKGAFTEIEPIAIPAAQGRPRSSSTAGRGHPPPGNPASRTLAGLRPACFAGWNGTNHRRPTSVTDLRRPRLPWFVMCERQKAEELGVQPIAELLSFGETRRRPPTPLSCNQPSGLRSNRRSASSASRSPTSDPRRDQRGRSPRRVSRGRWPTSAITDEIVNVNVGARSHSGQPDLACRQPPSGAHADRRAAPAVAGGLGAAALWRRPAVRGRGLRSSATPS